MPLVSVILPTYNRADTVRRAIESVRNQTLQDWELLVVDDGSTDDTAGLITARYAGEPRLKLIRQENQGVSAARNAGLRASSGKYLAFIDSDDEFLPHHLELESAFLESHPEENMVSSELWESFGRDSFVRHYQIEIWQWYPEVARIVGSRMLDLPPGETDNYLRVYQTRKPIGAWGRRIVERLPYEDVYLYRGKIYEQLRWGFLMCVQPSMITRRGLADVGEFDPRYRAAADFGFMAELCRRYTVNYLSIPMCIKHELAPDGKMMSESHIATGATGDVMGRELIDYLEKLFYKERPDDPELAKLLGWRQYCHARLAVSRGRREESLHYLSEAARKSPGLWRATLLYYAVKLTPWDDLLRVTYNTTYKLSHLLRQVWSNERTVAYLMNKLARRLGVMLRPAIVISLDYLDVIPSLFASF
jgi:glycosyltransferase involved in cell wall biosynthesis